MKRHASLAILVAVITAACGSPKLSASIGPNGASLNVPPSPAGPAQGPTSPNGPPRKAQSLPVVDPGGVCRLEGTRLGSGLVVQSPQGTPIVDLSRISGVTKATLQLVPGAALGIVQAENATFTFHGETKIDTLTVYPKQGALAQAGVTYRMWSHLEPGSAKPDGKVSLATALPYPWFSWVKGPTPSSLPIQVACTDLGLSAGSLPSHFARSQGGAFLKSDTKAEFRDLATGPVTARIQNPVKEAVSSGANADVDVLLLGKAANGKLTQVDVRIGQDLNAVGWVPSSALRPAAPTVNVLGAPTAASAGESIPALLPATYTYRRCNMNVPLWAAVVGDANAPQGTPPVYVELGTIKAGRPFRGALLPNGDFRVNVGDNAAWSDKAPTPGTLDPIVSKESLVTVGCGEIPASTYQSP